MCPALCCRVVLYTAVALLYYHFAGGHAEHLSTDVFSMLWLAVATCYSSLGNVWAGRASGVMMLWAMHPLWSWLAAQYSAMIFGIISTLFIVTVELLPRKVLGDFAHLLGAPWIVYLIVGSFDVAELVGTGGVGVLEVVFPVLRLTTAVLMVCTLFVWQATIVEPWTTVVLVTWLASLAHMALWTLASWGWMLAATHFLTIHHAPVVCLLGALTVLWAKGPICALPRGGALAWAIPAISALTVAVAHTLELQSVCPGNEPSLPRLLCCVGCSGCMAWQHARGKFQRGLTVLAFALCCADLLLGAAG